MKKVVVAALVLGFLSLLPGPAVCGGDLDAFVGSISAQARVDLPGFKARVSAEFGVPVPEVEAVIGRVRAPEDAYMVLRVAEVSHQPRETVLREYESNPGRGWGVIAKDLGIKPGSAEFHALKKGFHGDGGGKGKEKSKGGGHGGGKGKGKKH